MSNQTQNALAALPALPSPEEIAKMGSSDRKYLPKFKIFWPIEDTEWTGKACLTAGENVREIDVAPYHIGVITARPCIRHSDKEADIYEIAYLGGKADAKYQDMAKQLATNKKIAKGVGYLVAVWPNPENCSIAVCETFASMTDYMARPFNAASLQKSVVARIDVLDHKKTNWTKSKKGSGGYYDPKKFSQFDQEEITKQQAAMLATAIKENEELIAAWRAR